MKDRSNDNKNKPLSSDITGIVSPARPGDLTEQLRRARQADRKIASRKKKAGSTAAGLKGGSWWSDATPILQHYEVQMAMISSRC